MFKHAALLVLLLATTLAGCKKDDDPVQIERGRSYLHILGAADISAYDLTFDYYNADNIVIDDFTYRRNFPIQGYANLEATDMPDEFGNGKMWLTLSQQAFANVEPDTLMTPRQMMLNTDESATLCLVDSFGSLTTLKMVDNINFPDDTHTLIRFVNLSSDQNSSGLKTVDGSLNLNGVGFMQNTDFISIPPYSHEFEVLDSSGSVTSTNNLYVYPHKAYTVYLSGSGNGAFNYFIH